VQKAPKLVLLLPLPHEMTQGRVKPAPLSITLLAFNDILQAAAGVEDAEEKQEEASPVPVGGGGKKAATKPKAAVSSLSVCLPSHPFPSQKPRRR
jgi:hypothetical protein